MPRNFPEHVKLIKVEGLNQSPFAPGVEVEGWEEEGPQVGQSYRLLKKNGNTFRTGPVQVVEDEGFETANSRYVVVRSESNGKGSSREKLGDTMDITCEPRHVNIRGTEGSVIKGHVNLKHENRVSDLFLKGEGNFIVMFDAQVNGVPGKTLVVNKRSIVWVCMDE